PPKQEYSYGFRVEESSEGEFRAAEGAAPQKVRFLKRLAVAEVSPVLKGAGINTRTLALKARLEASLRVPEGLTMAEHLEFLAEEGQRVLERIAAVEEKFTRAPGNGAKVQALARIYGDIKAALELPPPDKAAALILARNLVLRERMLRSGTVA
ncbi:MAG: hypothetical protein AAB368_03395, partial [bacterium]